MKQKILLLILCLISQITLANEVFSNGNLKYSVLSQEEKTCEVMGYYQGIDYELVIPSEVQNGNDTYKVIQIGQEAFFECKDLVSVTLPESITKIEGYAFSGCI